VTDQGNAAAGKWNVTINTPMGDQAGVLDLRVDGTTLSGSMSAANYLVEIGNGRIIGNQLEWSAKLTKPMRMTLKFTATVDADRIEGHAKHLLGSASFAGTRA
jgi:hypothetical protein